MTTDKSQDIQTIDVSFRQLATHHNRADGAELLMDWDESILYLLL